MATPFLPLSPQNGSAPVPTGYSESLQGEELHNDSVLQSSLFDAASVSTHCTLLNEQEGNTTIPKEMPSHEIPSSATFSDANTPFAAPFHAPSAETCHPHLLRLGVDHPSSFLSTEQQGGEVGMNITGGRQKGKAGVYKKPLQGLASAQVNRVAKSALPPSMLLSKDAKAALQKAATVAVWYIGAVAATARDGEETKKKTRLTLLPVDVTNGLEAGGWGSIIPQLSSILPNSSSGMKRSR